MTNMTKPPQILIVEDEILIAMDLEDMVAEMGGTAVASAHNIQTAIKLAESIEADAAILDVDVAGQLVFPVADILQARDVPIIFHTGHGLKEDLMDYYGCAEVFSKPSDDAALRHAMTRMISGPAAGTG